MIKHLLLTISLFVNMMILFSISAAAYLDPSVLTYVIQAVAGVVIAGGTAFVIYWKKIKLFFKKKKQNKTR